jgi:glycosyltransferase involved in cell wall biosynthesis
MSENRTAKKILLISSNSSGRGGGERYLVFMAMGLIASGCEVHALLSQVDYMDGWEKELIEVGVTVHRKVLRALVDRPLRFIQSMLDFKQHKCVARFCSDLKPDVILVIQQYDEDGLDYLMGALKSSTCPVAAVMHMPMTVDKDKRMFGRIRGNILRRWYKSHPYTLIFSSRGSLNEFNNYYNLNLDTKVILTGVPLDATIIDQKQTLGILNDQWIKHIYNNIEQSIPVIGVACQFVPQKNLSLLIDSWLWVAESGVQTRLLLIGDGPERKSIEKRLANVDQSLWHITGWEDKYACYMAHLDIFVMPSFFEGLPLALIEAVGMGIPTIVSGVNGAEEVMQMAPWVDICYDPNVISLGNLIIDKANNLSNQKKAASLGRKHFITQFSPEQMAMSLLQKMSKKREY